MKWLIALAKTNPLVFSVALLLIAIAAMAKVIVNREQKIDQYTNEKALLQVYYNIKLDSVDARCNSRILQLTDRIEEDLRSAINDYKQQLEIQKRLNRIVDSTLNKNKKILNKNRTQIKILNLTE